MKRWPIYAVALLVACAPAPAPPMAMRQSATGGSTTARDRGPMVVDIRDFGAIEGTANATKTTAAIQRAHDWLVANRGINNSATIYVPSAKDGWYINAPINIDGDNIDIAGDGPASAIKCAVAYAGPMFLHGMGRTPVSQSLTSDHVVDAFGKLDSTAVTGAGQKYGLHVKTTTGGDGNPTPDSNVCFWGSAFQAGSQGNTGPADFWAATDEGTIEWCEDWTGLVPHYGPKFGMSNQYNVPLPWFIFGGNQFLTFYFRTQDGSYDGGNMGGPIWAATVDPSDTSGVRRFVYQWKLSTGTVNFAEDSGGVLTQRSVSLTGGSGGLAGKHFTSSQNAPFKIGAMAWTGNQLVSPYFTYSGTADRTFYGLRISKTARYNFPGTGQAITRVDSSAINDASSYFLLNSNLIAYLPLTDTPSNVAANRFVRYQGGKQNHYGYGFFTSANHFSPNSAVKYLNIRNVRIEGVNFGPYGQCVSVGYSIGVNVKDSTLRGGAHAFDSPTWGSNYTHKLQNLTLNGADAAIYDWFTIMDVRDCNIEVQGRTPLWLSGQSTFNGDRIEMSGFTTGNTEFHARSVYGGVFNLTNSTSDFEGGGPSVAGFYAEDGGSASIGAVMRLSNLNWGTIADDTPFALLHQTVTTQAPNRFDLSGLKLDSLTSGAMVQTDGPSWNGKIETDLNSYQSPMFDHRGATGASNLTSVHRGYAVPPAMSKWSGGAHDLNNAAAVDGQWSRWKCLGSGRYGTATPPVWQGSEARDDGNNALAAYFCGSNYWSVSGALHGWWTSYAERTVLNGLFAGGTIPAAPTTVYLGLATVRALDIGANGGELSGNAYARVAVVWNASSAGATANTGTITFPTATANWTGIRCLTLWDASSGGHQIAVIELATPITVASGSALSYGAGAITLAPVARTASRPNAWASGVNDRINNYWLRAASLSATPLYLALSTAPADPTSSPTEPIGNGYTRVQVLAANVPAIPTGSASLAQARSLVNGAARPFPSPSGSWGTIQSVYLMDASSAGNTLDASDLPVPRPISGGSTAPSFAVGSIYVQRRKRPSRSRSRRLAA